MTVDDTRRHPNAGARNRSAKLTEEQAREIKRSREPLLVLAARYQPVPHEQLELTRCN